MVITIENNINTYFKQWQQHKIMYLLKYEYIYIYIYIYPYQ